MAEETKNAAADKSSEQENAKIAALQAENAGLKNQVAEQDALIAELQQKLESAATTVVVSEHPVVVVGKKKYQVLLKQFKFRGQEYKATELKEETVKALLEAKVEFLKEI